MSSSYEEVFDGFTDRQLVSILEEQDYKNVRILASGVIGFMHNSMNYLINNNYNDGSMGILIIFNDIDMSFVDMNEWNKDKRFATVYKDDNGHLCLKMDFESGMTEAYLIKSIKRFTTLQAIFSLSKLGGLAALLNMFK